MSDLPALKREIQSRNIEEGLLAEQMQKEEDAQASDDGRFVFGQFQNLDSQSFRSANFKISV